MEKVGPTTALNSLGPNPPYSRRFFRRHPILRGGVGPRYDTGGRPAPLGWRFRCDPVWQGAIKRFGTIKRFPAITQLLRVLSPGSPVCVARRGDLNTEFDYGKGCFYREGLCGRGLWACPGV